MTRTPGSSEEGITRRQFLTNAGMLGAVALGSGGLLAACGGAQSGRQSVDLTATQWPTLLLSVPWAVAIEQGYFEENGIDLGEMVSSSGGGTTVRNIVTGDIPLGATATPAAINAYESGAPVKLLANVVQGSGDINFVTLPDRGIESIEDLRGKRVGFSEPGSVTQGLIVLSLQKAGIDPSEVELQAMGGLSEALTGLKEGAVDAAPHLLPRFLMEKDEGWQVVFWTNDYVQDFVQISLVTSEQVVDQQTDLVQNLVNAYQQAVDFTISNPEQAAEAWVSNSEIPEDAALESIEWVDPSSYYEVKVNPDGLNTVVEQMKAIDLLEPNDEVDWEGLLDQQFLPEDKRVDLAELG
jgi:NitT/TauT family transport system substrate-binding protein